ncbi:MAG: hypothetical protein AAF620_15595 [Bacteroidota bacterium]
MRLSLLILLICSVSVCFGQGEIGKELPSFNLFNRAEYTIKAYKYDEELKFKYVISRSGDDSNEEEFILETNTVETFRNEFKRIITKFQDSSIDNKRIETEANKIFYYYVAASKAFGSDKGPLAGQLTLRRDITIYRALSPSMIKYLKKKAKKFRRTSQYVSKFKRRFICDTLIRDTIASFLHFDSAIDSVDILLPKSSRIWHNAIKKGQVKSEFIRFYKNTIERSYYEAYAKKRKELCAPSDSVLRLNRSLDFISPELIKINNKIDSIKNINSQTTDQILKHVNDSVEMVIQISNFYGSGWIANKLSDQIKRVNDKMKSVQAELNLIAPPNTTGKRNATTLVYILRKIRNYGLPEYDADSIRATFLIIQSQGNARLIDGDYGPETEDLINKELENFKEEETKQLALIRQELLLLTEIDQVLKTLVKKRSLLSKLSKLLSTYQIELDRYTSKKLEVEQVISHYENQMDSINYNLGHLIRKLPKLKFESRNSQLEFKDGFIENIKTVGIIKIDKDQNYCRSLRLYQESKSIRNDKRDSTVFNTKLKFDNYFPLGFSREKDYQYLNSGDQPRLIASTNNSDKHEGDVFYMPTSELFENYIQDHKVGRRDFSPKNDVVDFEFNGNKKETKSLHKIQRKKLFEARVYSDFLGFQNENENGLIQTEVSKQLNINTRRIPFSNYTFKTSSNYGYLTYVIPITSISKIEDNNRQLLINYRDAFINNQYSPDRFVSTLQLKSHENFSTGLDLNLFLLDWPTVKSTFYVDAGFRYGRTQLRDSLRQFDGNVVTLTSETNDFNIDTYQIMPVMLRWKLQTDERYEFDFNWSWNRLYLRDNDVLQTSETNAFISSNGSENNTSKEQTYFRMELNAQYNSDNNAGKIFFRYRYHWQNKFWNTGFSQIQLGYSFFIMGALGGK